MAAFASLPQRSIRKKRGVIDSMDAIASILALAQDVPPGAQPRLLSDLGKTLQAQPSLRHHFQRSLQHQQHLSSLFSLAAANPALLSDACNVSQLATAQVKTVHFCPEFWSMLERSGTTLHTLPARELDNVVYSAAKLCQYCGAPRPSPALQQCIWGALSARHHQRVAEMNAFSVSNVVWALANLGLRVPADTLEALLAAVARLAPRMAPQGVAKTWWALATLEISVTPEVQAAQVDATVWLAPRMVPQDVAKTWWALAKMRVSVPPSAHGALVDAAGRVAPDMSAMDVANTWRALAALRMLVPAVVRAALLDAATRAAPDMAAQHVADTWWALATLGVAVSSGTHAALLDATVRLAPGMAPEEVCDALWGLGVLAAVPADGATAASLEARRAAAGMRVSALRGLAAAALTARLLQLHEEAAAPAGGALRAEHLVQVRSLRLRVMMRKPMLPTFKSIIGSSLHWRGVCARLYTGTVRAPFILHPIGTLQRSTARMAKARCPAKYKYCY